MTPLMRVTGAWTGLLQDWLDTKRLAAPELRAVLARWRNQETVPIPIWRELLSRGLLLAGDQDAPELAVGAGVNPSHVGVLGYLVMASDTLGEAIFAYQRYERLLYGVSLAEVEVFKDEAEIRWPCIEPELGQQADGVSIAALISFLRRQLQNPPPPSRISFRGALTAQAHTAYQHFFNCPVVTEDSHVRVRFPVAQLNLTLPTRDPMLRELLDRQAQAMLRVLPVETELDQSLHQLLPKLLSDGRSSLEEAAERLHMSPRTLQRRLAARGLSWQAWLDRSREELALHYLQDPGLNLSDTALLLGFSEQSAFTRAYRRWTGTTPGRARRAYFIQGLRTNPVKD